MEPEQQFLDYVIKAMVNHPEAVEINRSVDNQGVLLTLRVHSEDMGKIVGKGGKIATGALRPLLHVVGMKHNARVSLKILEPVGGRREAEIKTVDQVVEEL